MGVSFPGESARYRKARNRLLARRPSCAASPRRWQPPGAASRPAPPPARRRDPQDYMGRFQRPAEASLA